MEGPTLSIAVDQEIASPPAAVDCVLFATAGDSRAAPSYTAAAGNSGGELRAQHVDFSIDGLSCLSVHLDKMLRVCDVATRQHRDTLYLPQSAGVFRAVYTQSSDRIWVAPCKPSDGHLYTLSVTQGTTAAAYALRDVDSSNGHWGGAVPPLPSSVGPSSSSSSSSAPQRPGSAMQQGSSNNSSGGAAVVPVYTSLAAAVDGKDLLAAVHHYERQVLVYHPLVAHPVLATPREQGTDVLAAARVPRCAAWSPDGQRLAVGCQGCTFVWDLRHMKHALTVFDHQHLFVNPTRRAAVGLEFCPSASSVGEGEEGVGGVPCEQQMLVSSQGGECALVDTVGGDVLWNSSMGVVAGVLPPKTVLQSSSSGGTLERPSSGDRLLAQVQTTGAKYLHYDAWNVRSSTANGRGRAYASFLHPSLPTQSLSSFPGTPLSLYEQLQSKVGCGGGEGNEENDESKKMNAESVLAGPAGGTRFDAIVLKASLHMREADPVRCVAVNRRFPLVAVAGRSVTWLQMVS